MIEPGSVKNPLHIISCMAIAVVLLKHPKKRAVVIKLYYHGAHFKGAIQIFLGIFGVLMYIWPGWSK